MKTRFFILLTLLCICMSAFSQKNIPTDNLYRVISVRKHCKNEYIIIAAKNKKLYYIISPVIKDANIDLSSCEKIKCGHKYDFKLYYLLPISERLVIQGGFNGAASDLDITLSFGQCFFKGRRLYHHQIYEGDNIRGRYYCKDTEEYKSNSSTSF